MERTKKNIAAMLDPDKAAYRLIAILYERGEINSETWKNVKDLERQEICQSTSLTNLGN